jgi:hypothetical protein
VQRIPEFHYISALVADFKNEKSGFDLPGFSGTREHNGFRKSGRAGPLLLTVPIEPVSCADPIPGSRAVVGVA